MLMRSRGNYTDKQVYRCSHLGGDFGKVVHKLFCQAMGMSPDSKPRHKKASSHHEDVKKFARDFQRDALFDYVPLRHHVGFANYEHSTSLKDPIRLGMKLSRLSKDLDFWRRRSQFRN